MDGLLPTAGPANSLRAVRDRVLAVVSQLLGAAAFLAIGSFLNAGPSNLINLGWSEYGGLALNAGLSIAFFVQHSGMMRRSYREWSARFVDEKYRGALFTIASSVLLLVLVVLWQKSSYTLVAAHGAFRLLLRAIFVLSVLGLVWAIRSLGSFDSFGVRSLREGITAEAEPTDRLEIPGPYRWVRHPMYLCCLLMIWSCPDLTADRLLFNVLWSGWIVAGTILEERDLVDRFGSEYKAYRARVPMLIPRSIRPVYPAGGI